ncbi:MAG: iron ABC transporter permease, partial [Spirochaetaceae bacterium]|nr:iron ABC transporter permease [Spirochaetaceae bacterium]
MFTKQKVIAFLAACAVFLALDLWMFSALKSSFTKTVLEDQKQIASAVARSAPSDASAIPAWLDQNATAFPGVAILYLRGEPGSPEAQAYGRSPALGELFAARKDSKDFAKGFENAAYLESYFSSESYPLGNGRSRLLFSPVANAAGDGAAGTVIVATDESRYGAFGRLADALALIALVIFALGFGIATFSRDPLTGYAILGLFLIAAVFVAYPLFEALRLTFVKEGRFSLDIWKQVLGNRQYLLALWGSVQLGAMTATFSTLIGFLFAFVVARTSIRGKKLLTALATMPVISPPFSLTLSIILLFGNNGLITKKLLHLE